MTKLKLHQDEIPYSIVSKEVLNDPKLSFKAKGIYAYMSKQDSFDLEKIAAQFKEGKASIQAGIKELKDSGWVTYTKLENGSGVYLLSTEVDFI